MIRATQAQAAHFILNKNNLARHKAAGVVELVQALIGLPADLPPAPFLAARARLGGFEPGNLRTELYQNRTLINNILMRSAAYIVPAEKYVMWYAATARQRNQDFNSQFRLWGLDNTDVEALAQAIQDGADWPATVETITLRLPQHLVRDLSQTSRGGRVSTTSNVALVLRWLAARGVLGARPSDPDATPLQSAPHLIYAPLSHWYPDLDLSAAPGEAEAQAALTHAYLAGFGPTTEADISFWTGFGKSETARAVNALAAKTTLTLVEGIPGMLLMLKEQAEALSATRPPSEPLINVLPADDPYTIAHRASRSRYFIDQKLQRHVFSSTGAAQPAIVVNGQIAGVWEQQDQQLAWRLLAEVDPVLLPLFQAELEHVAAFIQPGLAVVQETS